jgi:hypothetical protein
LGRFQGRRSGRRAISYSKGRAYPSFLPGVAGSRAFATSEGSTGMLAHAYFRIVDQISAAHTDAELADVSARVVAIAMHPFERRAPERQLRARELAMQRVGRPPATNAADRYPSNRYSPNVAPTLRRT